MFCELSCELVIQKCWRRACSVYVLYHFLFGGCRTCQCQSSAANNVFLSAPAWPLGCNLTNWMRTQWCLLPVITGNKKKNSGKLNNRRAIFHPSIHYLPLLRGSGRGGSSLSRDIMPFIHKLAHFPEFLIKIHQDLIILKDYSTTAHYTPFLCSVWLVWNQQCRFVCPCKRKFSPEVCYSL